jgi:hypothetical protein
MSVGAQAKRSQAKGGAGPRRGAKIPDGLEPVTALLCTAREFPGELGATYADACARIGLPPRESGYALRLAQDPRGARWTIVSGDVAPVSAALSIHAMGIDASLAVDAKDVDRVVPGWPVPCPLGLADRPAPHDPPARGPVLRPTEPGTWAPTRRALADQIAGELLEPSDADSRELHLLNLGINPAEQPARLLDLAVEPMRPDHEPAVLAALDQASALARDGAAAGALRAVRTGDRAVLVRATGAGWSLVARPHGGPAVMMLDELPGSMLEITRAAGLDQVLGELDAAAPDPRRSPRSP